ncbi:MAG TPA: hypothetical protein VGD54_13665 [Steroidobacteraceae bacterium]
MTGGKAGKTMKSGEQLLILTPKGTEELRNHAYELDVTARNILALIEQGCKTTETILQRSMFPHNAVVDALRRLLRNKFVAMDETILPRKGDTGDSDGTLRQDLRLKFGISPAQARFALANFCMDEFGTDGHYLVDAVSLCSDVMSLQEVLNSIRSEMDEKCPHRLPALFMCLREINETDDATGSSPIPDTSKSGAAVSSRAPWSPRAPAPASPSKSTSSGGSPAEQVRLQAGVSQAQARFALSEFCLNEFGVRGQALVDAVNRCVDVRALQKMLNLIHNEVQSSYRDRLPTLIACVREVNETAQ